MPEEEFEVRGAHDDVIDEAAERGAGDPFVGRIALTTAILATIGAVLSYEGGATQASALMYKNEAASRRLKLQINGISIRQRATSKIWLRWRSCWCRRKAGRSLARK